MGLDATVMCRCYADGLCRPPPFHPSELYVDEDGYLTLRNDDSERWGLLYAWECSACAHEEMCAAAERIGNWSAYRLFQQAMASVGWEHFPTLQAGLPNANGGTMPALRSARALTELERFRTAIIPLAMIALVDSDTGEELWQRVEAYEGTFIWSGSDPLDVRVEREGVAFVATSGEQLFRARRVEQVGSSDDPAAYRAKQATVRFTDRDSGATFVCYTPISVARHDSPDGPVPSAWHFPRYLHVATRAQTAQDHAFVVNALERVFRASVETGNPVRWC